MDVDISYGNILLKTMLKSMTHFNGRFVAVYSDTFFYNPLKNVRCLVFRKGICWGHVQPSYYSIAEIEFRIASNSLVNCKYGGDLQSRTYSGKFKCLGALLHLSHQTALYYR